MSGSFTSYVVPLSVASLPATSVATTVTVYVSAALSAVIAPSQVSLTSVSATSLAVTLATPESASAAVTDTLIDPFGATTAGSSTTEVISGAVVSTTYVFELSSATLFNVSVATTVTLYMPDVLSAVIAPSQMPLTSASATSLAVTLATPAASVATTFTLIDPFGTTNSGSSTTE